MEQLPICGFQEMERIPGFEILEMDIILIFNFNYYKKYSDFALLGHFPFSKTMLTKNDKEYHLCFDLLLHLLLKKKKLKMSVHQIW